MSQIINDADVKLTNQNVWDWVATGFMFTSDWTKKTFCKIKLSLFSTHWELLCLIFNSSCHNGSVTCSSDVKCLIGESRVPYQLFFHVKLILCSPGNIHTHPMEGISRSVLNPFVLKLYHANNFLLHLIVPISPFKIQSWHFCSSLWAWSGYAKQL